LLNRSGLNFLALRGLAGLGVRLAAATGPPPEALAQNPRLV
jgi:hypothetical protein